jgi:Abortive infection alpha
LVLKLLGKPASEMGELLRDVVQGWRLSNLTRTAEKLERILKERGLGVELKPLPTGVALALVEAVSREDEEDVQRLWAQLLANHADPNRSLELDKDVIEIVRQLTSVDARVLEYLAQPHYDIHRVLAGGFDAPHLAQTLGVGPERLARSINNLWRLGCLLQQQAGPQMLDGGGLSVVGPSALANVSYRPSPLGDAILDAVAP